MYHCTDRDAGHNSRHEAFFLECDPAIAAQGIAAALEIVSSARALPAQDDLHLWKTYGNKISDHPVTLRADRLVDVIGGDDLEGVLEIGPALHDRSSVGPGTA
jgi:hypothetical protein